MTDEATELLRVLRLCMDALNPHEKQYFMKQFTVELVTYLKAKKEKEGQAGQPN
jgi:hypothetical protein